MLIIGRVFLVSLLFAAAGAMLGYVLFGKYSDWNGIALLLGCVGTIIGGIAGATREIAFARKP